MVFYFKGNEPINWIRFLLPLYYLVIGLVIGNSVIAIFQPSGWIIWLTVIFLELIPFQYPHVTKFTKDKSQTKLQIIQQIRRGVLLAVILDAFRLGS
uniref:Hypothetical chloroplast RF20 n=1 Tax=Chloroparvula japonica TaxID=1411623 RepID=A0A4D6C369_9CHLO|nr:hypothetical chloroplast RF20 [Chloroparvula japonica]QBX98161.1 hypothetical chloroplast RF20 [Chloroparvula japonica]